MISLGKHVLPKISAKKAYFIKLGSRGEWENECLHDSKIRLGYRETPHDLCLRGDWEAVQKFWEKLRGDAGTATRDMRQIQAFYEADEDTVFITFAHGLMHWCRPSGSVTVLADNGRLRGTIDGWSSKSVGGIPLTVD